MADSRKLLLVGWDAADWKIIHPLMDAGHMPTVARLVENGVMGNLTTLSPALSPMLWTSIATGKRPFKHGIYGFTEPTPDGQAVQPMTNTSRKCKAIWNILNQNDRQSIVVGWWPSHPAEPINGVMVSDYYHKVPKRPSDAWPLMRGAIHPARCYEELFSLRLHPSEVQLEHILPFIPQASEVDQENDPRMSTCMRMFCECTTLHAAATHLMETESWDFMAVYYDSIDHFCHGFMRYRAPKQDHISESDFKLYQHVVTAGYLYHDMMLGRLLELAGDDTTVILMSDHGFHPDHLRPKMLPAEPAGPALEHRDYGIFVMSGPGIRNDHVIHGANLLDITPTILTVYGLPVGEDMDGQPLLDAFEDPPVVSTISSWEDRRGDDGQHRRDFRMDPEEAKEAMEQLVALGYIDRPAKDGDKAVKQCQIELDYNQARSYMDATMYGEAIPLLARLYRENPVEFRFGVQLANCLNAMGRYEELKRLIEDLNGRWRVAQREARAKLSEVAQLARQRKEQWEDLRQIDEENKDDPSRPKLARRTVTGRPMLFTDGEKYLIRKLRAVARGNPQTLDFLAATVAVSEENYEASLELLEKAELTKSTNPNFQVHVGNIYLELGRLEDAERAYRKALEYDEFHPKGLLGLARLYLDAGEDDKGLDYATQAVGLKYHFPEAHYYLGLARQHMGDIDGAIASYQTAIAQNPNFIEAHQRLVEIYRTAESHLNEELADEHQGAARELRWASAKLNEEVEPIELPSLKPEDFRESLPELRLEEERAATFRRCLAQVPTRSSRDGSETSPPTVTVVSGLPRSGTSAMMQMLIAAGMTPFTDREREADESNPRGYFEAERVKQLPHSNSWLEECDGQVVKVVAPLLPYLPQDVQYRVIFMQRDFEEILDSQTRMLERLNRSGGKITRDRLAHVFAQQVDTASTLMALHRVPVLRVSYADLISDPTAIAQEVANFLGGDLEVEAMASAVDPSLHRERSSVEA